MTWCGHNEGMQIGSHTEPVHHPALVPTASQDYFFHKEGTANGGNRFLTVGHAYFCCTVVARGRTGVCAWSRRSCQLLGGAAEATARSRHAPQPVVMRCTFRNREKLTDTFCILLFHAVQVLMYLNDVEEGGETCERPTPGFLCTSDHAPLLCTSDRVPFLCTSDRVPFLCTSDRVPLGAAMRMVGACPLLACSAPCLTVSISALILPQASPTFRRWVGSRAAGLGG